MTDSADGGPLRVDALAWSLADSVDGPFVNRRFYQWLVDDTADGDADEAARVMAAELNTNLVYLSGGPGTRVTVRPR